VTLIGIFIFVPYPLKMDANGQLLPETRRWVYSLTEEATIVEFKVAPGEVVREDQELVLMFDRQLQKNVVSLTAERFTAFKLKQALESQRNAPGAGQADRQKIDLDWEKQDAVYRAKDTELNNLLKRTNSIEGKPGYFWIKSPSFNNRGGPGMQWTVLN